MAIGVGIGVSIGVGTGGATRRRERRCRLRSGVKGGSHRAMAPECLRRFLQNDKLPTIVGMR